ncbi:MAG: hypothetical protein IID35_05975 [Planctomycetes bacterium]|nr:hypothetical protein [Planctomycetota bacterium]
MKMGKLLATSACIAAVSSGCSMFQHTFKPTSTTASQPKVTVRFVVPPEFGRFTDGSGNSSDAKLVNDGLPYGAFDPGFASNYGDAGYNSYHVVLWGGPFNGDDVSFTATPLAPGSYTFGVLDPENEAVYQGWISVNNGGDDVLSVLTEWRATIHEQEEWLGFENRVYGKLSSSDPEDFERFTNQLKMLRELEKKINAGIKAELSDHAEFNWQRHELLSNTEILLIPGMTNFFRPSTKPAFREAELAAVRAGEPITKVVLVGDYAKSMEKLRRLVDLQRDLRRSRKVFAAEVNRLEARHRYFRMTDHLYDHGTKYAENEKQMQRARRMMARIDRQLEAQRRRCQALQFVVAMFAPDEAMRVFSQQQAELGRDRTVLIEQKHQIDVRFGNAPNGNARRTRLEAKRQSVLAEIAKIDAQIEQIEEARVAITTLRESTSIIHRHGTAHIVTASLMNSGIPAYLADAIERESLMTIRLQQSDSVFMPPSGSVAKAKTTSHRNTQFDHGYSGSH